MMSCWLHLEWTRGIDSSERFHGSRLTHGDSRQMLKGLEEEDEGRVDRSRNGHREESRCPINNVYYKYRTQGERERDRRVSI